MGPYTKFLYLSHLHKSLLKMPMLTKLKSSAARNLVFGLSLPLLSY